jgi:uncharacterized membrane protein
MVVSHHPPTQYDRTFKIFGVRICVRCVGIIIGIGLGIAIAHYWILDEPSLWLLSVLFIATLLIGIEAFVRNEAGTRKSSNAERIAFGITIGFIIAQAFVSGWMYFFSALLLILIGQFYSAVRLRKCGILDAFLGEYFNGAIIEHESDIHRNGQSYIFCACDVHQGLKQKSQE